MNIHSGCPRDDVGPWCRMRWDGVPWNRQHIPLLKLRGKNGAKVVQTTRDNASGTSAANSNVQRYAGTRKNQFTSTIHRRVRSPCVPSSPRITSFKKRMAPRHLCLLSGDYSCLAVITNNLKSGTIPLRAEKRMNRYTLKSQLYLYGMWMQS